MIAVFLRENNGIFGMKHVYVDDLMYVGIGNMYMLIMSISAMKRATFDVNPSPWETMGLSHEQYPAVPGRR